jgi:hypothetical protein
VPRAPRACFQRQVGSVGKGKQGVGAWGANKTLTSEIDGASGAHHAATESSKCGEIGLGGNGRV